MATYQHWSWHRCPRRTSSSHRPALCKGACPLRSSKRKLLVILRSKEASVQRENTNSDHGRRSGTNRSLAPRYSSVHIDCICSYPHLPAFHQSTAGAHGMADLRTQHFAASGHGHSMSQRFRASLPCSFLEMATSTRSPRLGPFAAKPSWSKKLS